MRKKTEHSRSLTLWQERLKTNEAAMAAEYGKMEKRAALYDGSRKIEKVPGAASKVAAADASNVRNIVAELIEAQVDPSFPMPKVTARKEAQEQLAMIAEDFLRNETDRLPFERLNDMDERISPIQGGSFFLVEWDSDRHTHETRGELCVSLLHPRQVILQNGVNEIEDMDFVIVNQTMTKKHVKEKYGVDVEKETESAPESRGGKGTAEDVVTVHFGYFRNDAGGIGLFVWVNDIELQYMEDYQARKGRTCKDCGAEMDGYAECPYCGSEKYEEVDRDTFQPYEDIQRAEEFGGTISQYEEVWEYPEEVEQPLLMNPFTGEAMEAQPRWVRRVREIPYYKPDVYPIVLRKNVSVWGKLLGDSDVDKIMDQQNTIKKCDTRIQEKLDKGGSILALGEDLEVELSDGQMRIVRISKPSDLNLIQLMNLQVDTSQDQNAAEASYQQARQILGITDSFQGRPDRTATSGTAKQIAVSQSAGRLESKRIMKNAMYADLYKVMFQFLLAYSDEPRAVRHKNIDGSTTYSEFNKYDFLAQDAAGEWYWVDDFLFSTDNSSSLAGNREAMWQEIRMNFQTGAFGNPQELDTQILFWGMMANQHYPNAAEVKAQLEQKKEQQMQQMEMQQMQQAPQMAPPGIADMGVEDGSGSAMQMMGGMENGM